jgi:polyhydroxybutyrate depolymerase
LLGSVAYGREQALTLQHGGLVRTCVLHVPDDADTGSRLPLVLVLHGRGGTGRSVERLTGFSRLADSAGFLVAYPEGADRRWNDGRPGSSVDDVGFLAALVRRLAAEQRADPGRVYATGISNGAMMCYRLACESSGLVAAIAPVAGAMTRKSLPTCSPAAPVPVLAINGTRDPLVGYDGGLTLASVRATIEFWVRADCPGASPETIPVPDIDPHDGTLTRCERWRGQTLGSEVLLYTVLGGGHTWPLGRARPRSFGRTGRDFDATRTIWEFFSRHRRD